MKEAEEGKPKLKVQNQKRKKTNQKKALITSMLSLYVYMGKLEEQNETMMK